MNLKPGSYKLRYRYRKQLADTVTPVNIYLRLRDKYAGSILLESSDYHGNENSFSYICCDPISSFKLEPDRIEITQPDGELLKADLADRRDLLGYWSDFINQFDYEPDAFKFISNGMFGYMAYDAVQYFEDIEFDSAKSNYDGIPLLFYQIFRYVISIDHFKNELHVFEHFIDGANQDSGLDEIINRINNKDFPAYSFQTKGPESSNFDDSKFLNVITKGRQNCFKGDVFQIVLSRQFNQQFLGDEFNVYRALRSINPSPYLYYFDFGTFKIFGSSPEAQIVIKKNRASIYPIAGTFRRTGDDAKDAEIAQKLYDDPKENSEHVMLVDLARNDLSRNGDKVHVETFKEIQYYSHVIHLVSKVSAELNSDESKLNVVASTFPAGTLSGAPKFRAMELIDGYEPTSRGFYGGAIGFLGFNGDFNHAIMIRSFLSWGDRLFYQAGAGVVAKSEPENEVREVDNKLAALRNALQMAAEIGD